ncbi:MAG: peptidoglycan-associated lipoprotein Pal [Gallionellaceae bacterium]|nr:peptidoglycan-associated lipoprotein Pal [Gallionellaceae bacterium]
MKKIMISALLTSLLAACASDPVKNSTDAAPVSDGSASSAQSARTAGTQSDPLNDPNSPLAKRSVYYPLDVYVVQDADRPTIAAHANYLAGNPNRAVRVEGNADERGSNEYNLALGQRRADGVKKLLEAGGAKSDQVETISYGEEKPAATGHDESAWAQNRRSDLNYNAR